MFPLSIPLSRRRDGRSPLALATALAVAVPGFLVTACSGQAGTGGSSPEVSAAASRDQGSPGNAGRVPAARKQSRAHAMHLLTQAAQSAIAKSYQGEEVVTRWNNGGGSVLVSHVWHASGGRTVTQTMAAGTSFSSEPYMSSDTDAQAPEGVLGVTAPLVQLLDAHYLVMYAGKGSAGSRPAQVVEAWRADGSLAARFWLDDATKLPLEREVFDSAVRVISQDVFFDVQLASSGPKAWPADAPADPDGPWTDPLSKAQLLALHSRGWQVPSALPGGLSLFTGAQTTTSTGTVLGLGYSDGLSVVSVFEQRGNLAARLAGWQKTTVGGHPVYVAGPDQRSLTWACRGMVYTVMADAPPQVTDAVVGALPHDGPPGFWKRISRGFARLATIVNPFG